MLNRLYTVIEKTLFYDPDRILISAFDYIEVQGDNAKKAYDKLMGFFPHANFDGNVSSKGVKKYDVSCRAGRRDKDIQEAKSILALQKINDVQIKSGREFYFVESADKFQIDTFIENNVNAYVFAREASDKEIVRLANENPFIKDFSLADYTELASIRKKYDLQMGIDDLMCVQNYFISESREPSLAEIKIIDNFLTENFRHTTFETILDNVETDDPIIKSAWEKYTGLRRNEDASLSDISQAAFDEIKDESVVLATEKLNGVKIESADENEEFVLISKCESHNRSTEIVPYDGAAGCIGGAVKDILCAFGYPYESYRAVGYGKNERARKNAVISSQGYTENASAMGVPCSKCKESVSRMYADSCMEICNVLAVANGKNTAKALTKKAQEDDKIYIIGGKTGSDGKHCIYSNLNGENSIGEYIATSDGAAVSGLIRLFLYPEFAEIAVAINDVSSGGIMCSLVELVDGADIDISSIQTHYNISVFDAILSESNERMIVCVREHNASVLEELSKKEGVDYCCIGTVNGDKRFVVYDENKNKIASLTTAFLLSGGAEKHLVASISSTPELPKSEALEAAKAPLGAVNPFKKIFGRGIKYDFERACLLSAEKMESLKNELGNTLNGAAGGDYSNFGDLSGQMGVSRRRLSYNGAAIIGKQGPVYSAHSCANFPKISKISPFKGAYLSVFDSVLKLVAAGYGNEKIYLTLHEYLPRHQNNSYKLGTSVSAMLGCFEAQMQLQKASLGGRISVGNKEEDNVSDITSFAFCLSESNKKIGNALCGNDNKVILISSESSKNGLPSGDAIKELIEALDELMENNQLVSAASVCAKNPCTVIMEMCRANGKGVIFDEDADVNDLFENLYAGIVCEITKDADVPKGAALLGTVADECSLIWQEKTFKLGAILGLSEKRPANDGKRYLYLKEFNDAYGTVKPVNGNNVHVLMPVGAFMRQCDDIVAKFEEIGALVKIFPLSENNISDFVKQIKSADILWLSDGFGNAAFLSSVLDEKRVKAEISALRERGGLVYGFGNAFFALLKNGLLDVDTDKINFSFATDVMVNTPVKIRLTSLCSAFLRNGEIGNVYPSYVTGKRLRLVCEQDYADTLAKNGRIAVQYETGYNSINSDVSIDAISSSDGCVLAQLSRPSADDGCLDIVKSAIDYFAHL